MESLVKLRMEKLSSHFMGQAASFPFARYRTEMCREYMSVLFWNCRLALRVQTVTSAVKPLFRWFTSNSVI
jgi:hypothetical protein